MKVKIHNLESYLIGLNFLLVVRSKITRSRRVESRIYSYLIDGYGIVVEIYLSGLIEVNFHYTDQVSIFQFSFHDEDNIKHETYSNIFEKEGSTDMKNFYLSIIRNNKLRGVLDYES